VNRREFLGATAVAASLSGRDWSANDKSISPLSAWEAQPAVTSVISVAATISSLRQCAISIRRRPSALFRASTRQRT
jgi:hypothetical protein